MKTQQPVFTTAPHRMMFFGGVLQIILVLVFWCIELAGRYTSWWVPLETTIPATSAHTFLMLYGLFPFFFFGFLMTTFPRWMGGKLVEKSNYITSFSLMISGMLLFYSGLFTGKAVLIMGVILFITGFVVGVTALLRVYFGVSAKGRTHESFLNVVLIFGCLGAFSFFMWLVSDAGWFLVLSQKIGLWLFVIPVVFTVCHRMLPFCVLQDYKVVQPQWSLPLLAVCVSGHALLEWFDAVRWLWLFDVPMMLMGFHHTVHWKFVRSFEVGLLAVLHISFLWFGLAMALYSIQSLTLLLSDSLILGRAPLHAIGIGFVSSIVVAMATRVTLGHSGRPLMMDTMTWVIYTGVCIAVLLRIAAEIPVLETITGSSWNLIAAITWLLCFIPWAFHYGPMYLKPRADGKLG